MVLYSERLGNFWEIVIYLFLGTTFTILEITPDRLIFRASNFVRSFVWVLMNFQLYGTTVSMCASGAISNFHVLSGNRSIYLRGLYLIVIKLSFSSSGSSGLEMSRDNLIYVFCNLFKLLYMF